jgi:hypothetical protein
MPTLKAYNPLLSAGPIPIIHHLVTALLGFSAFYPYAQYSSVFFFGVVELSSVFLSFVNILGDVPGLDEKYPTLNFVVVRCSVSFYVFLFPLFSIVLFPPRCDK